MGATLDDEKDAIAVGYRHLFDLNGFLIVRNVLVPEEVAVCHAAIDRHTYKAVLRSDPTLRNAIRGSPIYESGPPQCSSR